MEKEGSSITLLCVARGAPEPSITWYNPDGDVVNIHFVKASNNTEVDEEGFISVTSMLNIPNLLRNNSGTYTCSASNIVMEETVLMNRTYSLTVICKLLIIVHWIGIHLIFCESNGLWSSIHGCGIK